MNTNFEIFEQSTYRLCATIVLKDETTCEVVNTRLAALGYAVDPLDATTWKYYRNLAGQYHATDVPMHIISMDTAEQIEFTVASLAIHRRTWREYQYGSRYYKELTEKYPQQKALIDGILNPVDIKAAIAAKDHSILYYDTSLVESRETNLIPRLQEWITGNFVRWDNVDYRINNGLFIAARLLILFMAMPAYVLNIRLDNCHTRFAHSYHIKRYLASFGPLDQYYEYMTEYQRLYFYRNIRYLMRNNGKVETFEELTKNVLTRRNLPLAKYDIQQNDVVMPDQLDPGVQFQRFSVNGLASALGEDIKSTKQMLYLQRFLARSNLLESTDAEVYIPAAMELNLAATANTKTLESNVLDLKESEPYTLADVLLNHWIYFADTNRYSSILTLNLLTGSEAVKINMKDAWVLFMYLYMRRAGWEMTVIPQIVAKRVRRFTLPTFKELRGITSKKYVDDAFINEALRDNPVLGSYVSVDGFVQVCYDIQQRMLLHRDLYVYRDNMYTYGEVKAMTDRFYVDIPVDMAHGQLYSEWLRERNLSFENYTPAEMDEVLQGILSQATGADLRVTLSLKDIHAAMLGIMTQLSSYSVQFIQQINEEAVMMFDWGHLRWNDQGGERADAGRNVLPVTKPLELTALGEDGAFFDTSRVGIQNLESRTYHAESQTLALQFELSGKKEYISKGLTVGVQAMALTTPVIDLATALTGQELGAYADLTTLPIASLFNKVASDDFKSP